MARPSTAGRGEEADQDVHYTTFIRLPFPRGDFVDPPLVDWDSAKDRALWQILSRNPRSADLEWKELAADFQVTLPFILQQAAWLYERQLSQVRAQMRKVSKDTVSSSSERTGLAMAQAMQRIGSTEKGRQSSSGAETPSQSSASATPRVASTTPREHPLTRQAPPMSRNTSTNTVTQSRAFQPSSPSKQPAAQARTPLQRSPRQKSGLSPSEGKDKVSDNDSSSSEESSDSDARPERGTPSKSQMFRRPPLRFMGGRAARARVQVVTGDGTEEEDEDESNTNAGDDDDDDDEEDAPAFLPLSADSQEQQQQDLGATLRRPQHEEAGLSDSRGVTKIESRANTDSSVSSAGSLARIATVTEGARVARAPGPLSPRQQAEIAKLSPRGRGAGREGSDGTRSMGSSFSDLDDTSVTQSALEEALMSNMQHGGASKMSNISQALRSRYL